MVAVAEQAVWIVAQRRGRYPCLCRRTDYPRWPHVGARAAKPRNANAWCPCFGRLDVDAMTGNCCAGLWGTGVNA